VAYRSTATGRSEVYLDRFPSASSQRTQLSTSGGVSPVWSPDGREVFYRIGNEIWSVDVSARASRRFGEPRRLFRTTVPIADTFFDVARDGRFLVVVGEAPASNPGEFQLTMNIASDLRRRAASQ
jgi:Tol biopolymer transport system component